MQRIVIDTNVLVSALLSEGPPSWIISNLVFERQVEFCMSSLIWNEYLDVFNREKFSKYHAFKTNAEIILSKLDDIALYFQPNLELDVIKDKTDNKFLELAVYANAEYLITGNIKDFTITRFEDVKIVSPRDYWENHR